MAKAIVRGHRFVDLTGQKFFRLTVLEYAGRNKAGNSVWKCSCECGRTTEATTAHLRFGRKKSCGCLQKIKAAERLTRHGLSEKPEYIVWLGMKGRCLNPNHLHYAEYGGRGITICERWLKSFANFYADMGPRPGTGRQFTLERRDNDGPYSPENCCWSTRTRQARNKRNNRLLTFRGETKSLPEWAEEFGLKRSVVKDRLRRQWDLERALTTPCR